MSKIQKSTGVLGLVLIAAAGIVTNGCSGSQNEFDNSDSGDPGVGGPQFDTLQDPLFEAATMDATAKLALLAAAVQTVAVVFDPLSNGNQVEFCGAIYKKPNGTFRADFAKTDYLMDHCNAPRTPGVGEKVVGIYHTHPQGILPNFSTGDKINSTSFKYTWYVISTVNACARKFTPKQTVALGVNTSLGCFPGSF